MTDISDIIDILSGPAAEDTLKDTSGDVSEDTPGEGRLPRLRFLAHWGKRVLSWKARQKAPRDLRLLCKFDEATQQRLARLEKQMAAEVKIFGFTPQVPKVCVVSELTLTPAQQEFAGSVRSALEAGPGGNQLHAVLVGPDPTPAELVTLETKFVDYAGIKALRHEGEKPKIVSACVVLICPEKNCIFINRRSGQVDTYAESLHTFGGAYIPEVNDRTVKDHSLGITAKRESHEEGQFDIQLPSAHPILLSSELHTGFFQITFLGATIKAADIPNLKENWEGKILPVDFDALHAQLKRPDFVPSGWTQILAWLALGAPGTLPGTRFAGRTPQALFDHLVH